jgi:hypothetical protein
MGSTGKPGDIGYIVSPSLFFTICFYCSDSDLSQEPVGIFQSELIIQVAQQFIGYAHKSQLEPAISPDNPPKGLYALILTAVRKFSLVVKSTDIENYLRLNVLSLRISHLVLSRNHMSSRTIVLVRNYVST